MSHILLINPKVHSASQSARVNALMSVSFPTSIAYLAGYLLKFQIEVTVVDEYVHPLDFETLSGMLLQLKEPRIVGISTVTLTASRAYELASWIKRATPDTVVIVGGIHATVVPDEVLAQPGVDLVVRGEGELVLKELVDRILAGMDPGNGVPGVSHRLEGTVVHNPLPPFLADLDEIPSIPFHLFAQHKERYSNFGVILGSRGCPYPCTFCSARSMSGMKYRFHSVERMLTDIRLLVRTYGQRTIHLIDDNIAVHKRHFMELCAGIIGEGLHLEASFQGSLRGDDARDDVLTMAKKANFSIIYFGLETGSERLMQVIRKKETVADVVDAIHRTHRHGIATGTTIIFGLPTETRKDRWDCMRLVRTLPLASVRFNTLAPYPGTQVYDELMAQNKITFKKDMVNFNVQYLWQGDDIPYVPDGNNRLELIFDTMFANLSFYLSPRGLRQIFTRSMAGGNVVKIKNKWYLDPSEALKMYLMFQYLFLRFLSVSVRMLFERSN
ncbi:MAG: B12-binding domain-containing radical SAM protein [Magnetococcales bacterium]|nr:B12-binding domain-containing radical SAM protein [Magnetococcales bacterium]MBF0156075.1 B12-binding domain-containing radical SAM protein [Magnetococcales bacterium]